MKILRINSSGYEQGGVENTIVLTNHLYKEKGHSVKVIASTYRPDLKHYSDYEFSCIQVSSALKTIFYSAFNFDAYRVTKKVLNEYKPDIVLLDTMNQPTASVLFLLRKYPTIQFVHGPEIFTKALLPWYLAKENYKNESYNLTDLTIVGRIHYAYFAYLCRPIYLLGFRNVNAFVAHSRYTYECLQNEKFNPLYIPNGAKLMNKTKAQETTIPIVLYSGRLEPYKGVDDLINAMTLVLKKIPNAVLKIAGDGSQADVLKDLVNKLGLAKSVQFLGHLNSAELSQVYTSFSVLVMPSTWPETFGKVGIEAMSTGRPVIACSVGGISDWLNNNTNGYLIEPHRPDLIAKNVIKVLTNSELAARLGANARLTAEKFSIEKLAINTELLMKQIAHVT
jgi:glycosyltransferase involved in cell wall biosynthesis